MARGNWQTTVLDADGDVQVGKTVVLYETDGSTPLAQSVYAAASGGVPLLSLVTNSLGQIEVYAPLGQYLTYRVDGGASQSGRIDPDPSQVVTLTDTQVLTGKTLTAPTLTSPTISAPIISGTGTFVNLAGTGTFYALGVGSGGFGGAKITSEGSLVVGKQVAGGAGGGNASATFIVNRESSTSVSEVMVNFDFTQLANASDSGTLTIFCGEGALAGRTQPTGGPANALRAIEIRGLYGTKAGVIAVGHGGTRQVIGMTIETQTATSAPDGSLAHIESALTINSVSSGQLTENGSVLVSPNSAIFINGTAGSASSSVCPFEFPIAIAGTGTLAASPIFAIFATGRTGLAMVPLSGQGMLQIRQSADTNQGGIRLYRNAVTTQYTALSSDTNGGNIEVVDSVTGLSGVVRVSSNTGEDTVGVTSPVGLTGALMKLTKGGVAERFKVDSAGLVSIQTTKVLGTQGAAVADSVGVIPAGGVGAAAGGFDTAGHRDTFIATVTEIQTQLNLLLARVRAATGHGLIA